MATKLKNLVLHELSFVDFPANKSAKVTIFKRADPAKKFELLAKALYAAEMHPLPAQSFNELVSKSKHQISDAFWPLYGALNESVTSIFKDEGIKGEATKLAAIRMTVEQFMKAVASELPDAEMELTKLLKSRNPAAAEVLKAGDPGFNPDSTGENSMSDIVKNEIAALKAQIESLTKDVSKAAETKKADDAAIADLTAKLKKAEDCPPGEKEADDDESKKPAFLKAVDVAVKAELAKRDEVAKGDEVLVIKSGDKDISVKKSEVGEATFAFMKAQQAVITTSNDALVLASFTKRAETELGALPGETAIKGKVLKAVEGIADEEVRKAALAALTAGNAALKSNMKPLGQDGGGSNDAATSLDAAVTKYATDNKVDKHTAMTEVLKTDDGKALYRKSLTKAAA